MQTMHFNLRQALRPLALAVAWGLACAAPVAQAGLIGDTVTFDLQRSNGATYSRTGVAGTDSLQIVFGGFNTRFDPSFQGDSINLGFATEPPAFGFSFSSGDTLRFSGLDAPGLRIASVALFGNSDLSQSNLSWTDASFTVELGQAFLRNNQTVRFDITFEPAAVTAVPEPGSLALLAAAGIGLLLSQRSRRRPG